MSRLPAAFACAAILASTALTIPAGAAPVAAPKTHPVITISNFGFHGDFTVKPGVTVTVKNKDSVTHTLTSNTNKFNAGRIHPGKTKTFVAPKAVGRYRFHCKIHTEMTGTLVVKRHA